MRIGIDYTAAVRQRAGIGRYAHNLIGALAELESSHQYTALVVGEKPLGDLQISELPNWQVRRFPLSERIATIMWQRARLPMPVELIIGAIDLFHSPDFVLPPMFCRHKILTVHDLSFFRVPQYAHPAQCAYLEKAVPRSVYRADWILADSRNTKRDLVELLNVPSERVTVIYAGVEARFKKIVDSEILEAVRARYNLPSRFILSLGTLEPRKNFIGLIRAYQELIQSVATFGDYSLVIGGGKGWLYEEIFETVEQLSLQDRVIFPGYIADADLPALYNLAEIFVFPSFYEGFGLPPLEAMACGTPVITSDRPSLPEVVEDAALMVDALDNTALARAMSQLLTDAELRAELRRRGIEQAKKFKWEDAARRLLDVYEKCSIDKR